MRIPFWTGTKTEPLLDHLDGVCIEGDKHCGVHKRAATTDDIDMNATSTRSFRKLMHSGFGALRGGSRRKARPRYSWATPSLGVFVLTAFISACLFFCVETTPISAIASLANNSK